MVYLLEVSKIICTQSFTLSPSKTLLLYSYIKDPLFIGIRQPIIRSLFSVYNTLSARAKGGDIFIIYFFRTIFIYRLMVHSIDLSIIETIQYEPIDDYFYKSVKS